MREDRRIDKRNAIVQAEKSGQVADSLEVRKRLIKSVERGEITLGEAQAELRQIKRGAHKLGLKTRSEVWRKA